MEPQDVQKEQNQILVLKCASQR